ncbi:hypothetical protein JCM6882_005889 [Rhodosporidiobolus microsporus]
MPPVDPGPRAILWTKNPAYSSSLLAAISNLPSRQDQHSLFSSAAGKSAQWKTAKAAALERVTGEVFTAGGDHERAKKQRDSTQRRITQLGKDYSNDINAIKADPYNVDTTLAALRSAPNSLFDALRLVLHDHPDFPSWDPDEDDRPLDDDPMQDVQHVPAPLPLAGPAYPNPLLPHHAPYLPAAAAAPVPAPDPAPAQPALAAPHHPPAPVGGHAAAAAGAGAGAGAGAAGGEGDYDDALDSCPVCSAPLHALSPSASESHLRACLDSSTGGASGAAGATLVECPVCGLDMTSGAEWEGPGADARREAHVGECLFVATEKTVPKDAATGEALECIMCLDSLLPSSPSPSSLSTPDPTSDETLARLSCHCVFHAPCITDYWAQFPGRWCPTHREMDEDGGAKGEVEMR